MRRRRMNGLLRRKSSSKPSPLKLNGDPKNGEKSFGERYAEQYGPKFDIPETTEETIDQEKVDYSANLSSYDINKRSDEIKTKDAQESNVSGIQKLQTGLTTLEFAEGPVGTIAGGVNALISGGRGIYHAVRGESAEATSNFGDAALSVAGITPLLGITATTAKQAKYLKNAGRLGQARHMDDAVEIVTGKKVGDVLSPEKDIIKKFTK